MFKKTLNLKEIFENERNISESKILLMVAQTGK